MGLDPSDTGQRAVLLRFANEAADELYNQADIPGSLVEQVFKVNGDQTISLPAYVGRIRAIREYSSQVPWHINQMRPRYNQQNWKDCWRNWRMKNQQCLQATITNQSVLVYTTAAVENPPVVVTVTGPTATATLATESVTLSSTQVTGTVNFLDLVSARKTSANNYDITISDVDGKLLTTIPNNELEAKYQIVDVSLSPWLQQTQSQLDHYVELLYKKILPWYSLDSDEFPAYGYDNAWVNKGLQLWMEEQGKADLAAGYDAKATRTVARRVEDENRATEDTVSLVDNPHDCIQPRIRPRRPGRYGGYSYPSRFGN